MLGAILEELKVIRSHLEGIEAAPSDFVAARRERQERPAA